MTILKRTAVTVVVPVAFSGGWGGKQSFPLVVLCSAAMWLLICCFPLLYLLLLAPFHLFFPFLLVRIYRFYLFIF